MQALLGALGPAIPGEAPGGANAPAARGAGKAEPQAAGSAAPAAGQAFGELLRGAVEQANRDQFQAEGAARNLAEGKGDVVDAMIAASHADVSLRFIVTLRNRILDAYQEIMRLQV